MSNAPDQKIENNNQSPKAGLLSPLQKYISKVNNLILSLTSPEAREVIGKTIDLGEVADKTLLRGMSFKNCIFVTHSDFQAAHIDFSDCIFDRCEFRVPRFHNCNFSRAKFINPLFALGSVDFHRCNMSDTRCDGEGIRAEDELDLSEENNLRVFVQSMTSDSIEWCTHFETSNGGWAEGERKRVVAMNMKFLEYEVPFLLFSSSDKDEGDGKKVAILFLKNIRTNFGFLSHGIFYSLPNSATNVPFRKEIISQAFIPKHDDYIIDGGTIEFPKNTDIVFRPFRPASLASEGFGECLIKAQKIIGY